MTIAAILKSKGNEVTTVEPTLCIADLCQVLTDRRVGAVPVREMGTRDQLLGMVSERDIIRALAAHGAATLQMRARDLMTRIIRTATPATTVGEAMQTMTDSRIRHLPVMESGKLVGIVSIGDVVKARIDDAEYQVDSLRAYVAGVA